MKYIITSSLALLLALSMQGQNIVDNLQLNPIVLEKKGDSLHIKMEVKISSLKIKSQKGIDYTPFIVGDSHQIELPSIRLKGRANYLAYERLNLSEKNKKSRAKDHSYIIRGNDIENQKINYSHTIAFAQWMKKASIVLEKNGCGCGTREESKSQNLTSTLVWDSVYTPYKVRPHLTCITPKVELIKDRESAMESYIHFELSNSKINSRLGNNPFELERIKDFVNTFKNDRNLVIKQITITGYASPEGKLCTNKLLSELRAKALENYLISQNTFTENLYSINFGGENWEGLIQALNQTDLNFKSEVLFIIHNYSIENGREKKIMELFNGDPYRYMLKHIFPQLRIAKLKVEYQVKNFNLSEAREIAKIKPEHLSLNELFRVANSYPVDSNEFTDLLETAAKLYPNNISILNAAIAALLRGDTLLAERHLNKVTHKGAEYFNAWGVLLMLKGDYLNAEAYLKKAQEGLLLDASKNLDELKRKKESDSQITHENIITNLN